MRLLRALGWSSLLVFGLACGLWDDYCWVRDMRRRWVR
jgi:hypothetical protein